MKWKWSVNYWLTRQKEDTSTHDQILEAMPEVETNLTLLDTIYEEAQVAGINVYETEEDAANGGAGEEIDLDDDSDNDHTAPFV